MLRVRVRADLFNTYPRCNGNFPQESSEWKQVSTFEEMLQSTVNFACGGKCNILPLTTYIITLSHFGEKKFINVFDDLFRAWILIQLKRYCVQCCVPSTYFGC